MVYSYEALLAHKVIVEYGKMFTKSREAPLVVVVVKLAKVFLKSSIVTSVVLMVNPLGFQDGRLHRGYLRNPS